MKKIFILVCSSLMVLSLGSCKSQQSAYKSAYEKAKEQAASEVPDAYGEVEEARIMTTPTAKPESAERIQSERVTVVNSDRASSLKRYSVVVGSYLQTTNANSCQRKFNDKGYDALLVKNEKGMFRVIATSFDTKDEAASSRDQIKIKYDVNDAWILENQY